MTNLAAALGGALPQIAGAIEWCTRREELIASIAVATDTPIDQVEIDVDHWLAEGTPEEIAHRLVFAVACRPDTQPIAPPVVSEPGPRSPPIGRKLGRKLGCRR